MPTKPKATPRRTPGTVRPTPAKPGVQAPRPAAPVTRDDRVHFSDKMTGALMNISRVIDDNKSTLDSIQDMAIELTRAIQSLRVVVMRYVGLADNLLETIVPVLDRLPVVPGRIKDLARDALELSNKITAASELAEKILPGVERSLMTADIGGLQTSTADVGQLTRALQDILPDSSS